MAAVLEAHALTKQYRGSTVLDAAELTLERGKIYALLGLNGAGKSTLMRIVAGTTLPTSGELRLLGASGGKELRDARRRCGFLIEEPIFYDNLSARQNLKGVCRLKGVSPDCIPGLLQTVMLEDTPKMMGKYSTGMKQRYGIAAALVGDPEFLILDEPMNGIDLSGIYDFCQMLTGLCRERKMTILLSSHILSALKDVADVFLFLHDGKISPCYDRDPEKAFEELTGRKLS